MERGRPAVFLDRDGVINEMVYDADHGIVDSPRRPEEFVLLPGVGEAIRTVSQLGYLVVIASNQPGVAKGKTTVELLERITQKMKDLLAREGALLDGVYYCLHHPEAIVQEYRVRCDCRKPAPGLLFRAAKELNIDVSASWMVGDGLTDVEAGSRAGCRTILLGDYKCELCKVMRDRGVSPTYVARDILAAAKLIREAGDR